MCFPVLKLFIEDKFWNWIPPNSKYKILDNWKNENGDSLQQRFLAFSLLGNPCDNVQVLRNPKVHVALFFPNIIFSDH